MRPRTMTEIAGRALPPGPALRPDGAERGLLRLSRDILESSGLIAVVAPRGYRKTALVETLRRTSPTVTQFESEACHPDGVALVDGVTTIGGPTWSELAAAVAEGRYRAVVATNRFPPSGAIPHRRIGPRELALDISDVAARARERLGASDAARVAAVVGPACDGWPRAVDAVLDHVADSASPLRAATEVVGEGRILPLVLPAWRRSLGETTAFSLAQLAHLDTFDDAVVEALALEVAVARASDIGLPLIPTANGLWRWVAPVAHALSELCPPDPATMRAAAQAHSQRGRPLAAIRALMAIGDAERAHQVVCDAAVLDLDNENQRELVAALRRLATDTEDGAGRLLLRTARAHRNAGELRDEQRCLGSLEERIASSGGVAEPEAMVELLYQRAVAGDHCDDLPEIEAFEPIASRCSLAVRTRWREARAIAMARDDSDWRLVERSCQPLEQVAHDWIEQNDSPRAAGALRVLAAAPLYHLGDYRAAQAALATALGLCGTRRAERAATTELYCRMSVLAGDLEAFDAHVGLAFDFANERSFPWMKAYLHWSQMHAAAARRRPDEVEAHWQAAMVQLRELRDHPTGVVFAAESATLFAQMDQHDRSVEVLETAIAGRDQNELEVAMAEVAVTARGGDLDHTMALAETLSASPILPPCRRWRVEAEVAVAHLVAGEVTRGDHLAQRAVAQAAVHGLDDLAARILDVPGVRQSPAPAPSAHVALTLLGEFRTEVQGIPVDLPNGHVTTLAKVLALADGFVADDKVVEYLWPDDNPDLGPRRLKNVVSRLRSALGSDVVRRERGQIALGREVTCDLTRFHRLARVALDSNEEPPTRLAAATDALTLSEAELLPGDLYADWVADHRHNMRTVASALFQYLLSRPVGSGPELSWLLSVAAAQFAEDDQILLLLTRRALAEGDGSCARQALEMAVRAADQLGVSLATEIAELGPRVGAPAGT